LTDISSKNEIVKQLSKYPTEIMMGASGSYKGLSITRVTELVMIRVMITPSKIFAGVILLIGGPFLAARAGIAIDLLFWIFS
jgi:hypothetical protein